jgi:hypothetical protein
LFQIPDAQALEGSRDCPLALLEHYDALVAGIAVEGGMIRGSGGDDD